MVATQHQEELAAHLLLGLKPPLIRTCLVPPQCWCGEEGIDYTANEASDNCNYDCAGDATKKCGGFNAMSVWQV